MRGPTITSHPEMNRASPSVVSAISVLFKAFHFERGTGMCPLSRRTIAAACLAIFALLALTPAVHAHGGGGGGHGGGGSGGSGRAGTGSRYGSPSHHSSQPGWGRGYVSDPSAAAASSIGWPSFPEDLPFARLHRFLLQHRPHAHVAHLRHSTESNHLPRSAAGGQRADPVIDSSYRDRGGNFGT
jgi:hypothetical protein